MEIRIAQHDEAAGAERSRRQFLRSVAAIAAGGSLALIGCGHETGSQRRTAARPAAPALPSLPAQRAVPPPTEPILRVCVARPRAADAVLPFGAADRWVEIEADGRKHALRGPVQIGCTAGTWNIRDVRGARPEVPAGAAIWISGLEGTDLPGPMSAALEIDAVPHPGMIRLHPAPRRTADEEDGDDALQPDGFDVVNHVLLEAYLPGVLVHELFRHWHAETFIAQAIAARSFALSEHAFFRSRRHFDVTNTQASQVYRGATDHRTAREAVRSTRGMVLVYERLVVTGYYSSCCGGRSASAVDAISSNPINDIPPLAGSTAACACESAPRFRWRIERGAADLQMRLAAYGPIIGHRDLTALKHLVNIEIAEVGRSGRPRTYLLKDRSGEMYRLPAERLRLGANRRTAALGAPAAPLPSGFLLGPTAAARGQFVLEGAGYGHGVGLCQYGAQAMAKSGRSAEQILAHAYPGASLHQSWS